MSSLRHRSVPVSAFVATDANRWGPLQELRARPDVVLAMTPRHASVLLVAGSVPADLHEAAARVHDQLPHPRAVVVWGETPSMLDQRPLRSVHSDDLDDVAGALAEACHAILHDPGSSAPDLLADREPNEWRGLGPFGQGGEGMMGGTPYGRPMAMTAQDRDGLDLDRLELRLGPFLDALPGGWSLDVAIQGEVVQYAELIAHPAGGRPPEADDSSPVLVNARENLRWLAHALHVHGLDAHAARAAALAAAITLALSSGTPVDDVADTARTGLAAVRRSLRGTGLRWSLRGVGTVGGVDAWGRWVGRLDAIASSLAGEPGEAPPAVAPAEISASLCGMALGEAIVTIVSHDLGHRVSARRSSR